MQDFKQNILPAQPKGDTLPSEKPRVMVVDDNPNIRKAIVRVLQKDFNVVQAESGDKAIAIFKEDQSFTAMTLDLEMPGLSGISTLKEIKKINPDMEVLILSAQSDSESARGALKYGAYAYIDKPFINKELREAVFQGIKRSKKHTDAKEASNQLEMVKAQLMESEKFSIIGQLVAGVSHEIKNPLTAILGYSDLVTMTEEISDNTKDYIKKIKASARLCQSIVEKLLSFSRKNEGVKESVNINSVVEGGVDLKEPDLKTNNINITFEADPQLPLIVGNFFELQQVFLNIITNACQAVMDRSDSDGKIVIKTEVKENAIHIIFQDNGPGIPEESLSKIFEPLFTTKPEGEGTGLGLSISFEIIKSHGGNIFVGNTEEGACFIVELPTMRDGKYK